jgi:hypothetical protein
MYLFLLHVVCNVIQLFAKKKTENENFPNVNLILSHLSINCLPDNTFQIILKNVIEF